MTAPRRIAIVIDHRDPATVAEAWRAAVGVSLRGAAVTVATRAGAVDGGPEAARARATLALFGHRVDAAADDLTADLYEHWHDGRGPIGGASTRTAPVLHLVRAGRVVGATAPGDRVVELGRPADVDYDAILDALADRPAWVW